MLVWKQAPGRFAFGMPGRAGQARSAAVVGPLSLNPKERGGRRPRGYALGRLTPLVTVEPQALAPRATAGFKAE
jgi:hypothetical protein